MKDVSINGLQFRFDNGCLDWMRQARGIESKGPFDFQNPLEGLSDQNEIAAVIMYGGLARVDEKKDRPVTYGFEACKNMLKDLSPAETSHLINSWSAAMTVTGDGTESNGEGEEKKSS